MQLRGTRLTVHKTMPLSMLPQWLPALFFLTNIYRMMGNSPIPYAGFLCLTGIVGFLCAITDRKIRQDVLLTVVGIYLITGVSNLLLIGNITPLDLMSDLLMFGVMIVMFAYPMAYYQGVIFFYISIAAFFLAYLRGMRAVQLLTSSSNYISVALLLSAAMYYIPLQNSDREMKMIDLLPAFLCFFLSVWARGRGGILSCAALLVMLVAYYLWKYASRSVLKGFFVVLAVGFTAAFLLYSKTNLLDAFLNLGKWKNRGTDNGAREIIWKAYFNKTGENPIYFFFGPPLDQISELQAFNNNTHNSFIQLHANNGLIAFLLFAFLLFRAMWVEVRKRKTLIAIVLASLFLRGMTDKFIFGQYGMPIMLYLVLYPFFINYIRLRRNMLLERGHRF